MAVSIADIQNLRKRTGAGMMDCKKALEESAGDYDKAIEIIRKKGQAFAAKRGDREALEGCVLGGVKDGFASLVALKCETDFVAINAEFIGLTQDLLNAALENQVKSVEDLNNTEIGGRKIVDLVTDRMGITGEKMEIGVYESISAPTVVAYVHPGNRLAAIVGFNKPNVDADVARDVAMQIAAMNPVSLTEAGVSEEIKEREKSIAKEKAREAGKPENLLDRIAEGALTKFYKEFTLLQQDFVKNPKLTIAQYLQQADKELEVVEFKRFTLNAD